MARVANNRPAEIFGYPLENETKEAQQTRERHWCPFADSLCNKRSGLLQYPPGVCSVEHHGQLHTICPRRFREVGNLTGIPRVLEDVTQHYFGDFNNVLSFFEVKLPNIGTIDCVLVRHKPLKAEVDDFVTVEFQADSTTGTGQVVQGVRDFFDGENVRGKSYAFGLNTYDSLKRSMTQLLNKGIVYERWKTKCYWVIQEYIYANLVKRYGFKQNGYVSEHASRFALYDLVRQGKRIKLQPTRFISTTVDEVYQAMRNNPGIPHKDQFVRTLNTKLRAKLNLEFR